MARTTTLNKKPKTLGPSRAKVYFWQGWYGLVGTSLDKQEDGTIVVPLQYIEKVCFILGTVLMGGFFAGVFLAGTSDSGSLFAGAVLYTVYYLARRRRYLGPGRLSKWASRHVGQHAFVDEKAYDIPTPSSKTSAVLSETDQSRFEDIVRMFDSKSDDEDPGMQDARK